MPKHQPRVLRRPRVLHLSADYPDSINPSKTTVISRLIDLVAAEYDHQVLSINRCRPTLGETARLSTGLLSPVVEGSLRPIERGFCFEYLAPSKGLLHASTLDRLAQWIAERASREAALPDLVIGHKLTVEGVLAREVARQLGVPYAITIQGNTDQKILKFRPDLASRFARIYHDAACVFSFAPWARKAVEQRLGHRTGLTLDLPCPTVFDSITAPVVGGDALISVFHLRNHKIKNLAGLAIAMQTLKTSSGCFPLKVIGGGNPTETQACKTVIARAENITLAGPRNPSQLATIMNGSVALVLPSKRESFGLVFIEALFAGLPIIYPKGASVDGYFDGLPFAIAVNTNNPREIADAMRHMITHEADIKSALARWQETGGLGRFLHKTIRSTFDEGLNHAVETFEGRAHKRLCLTLLSNS